MYDYLEILKLYKSAEDVAHLIDDVQKLRFYYSTQQCETMIQHIRNLVNKYPFEAKTWNSIHPNTPNTYEDAYLSAEMFLKLKAFALLLQKGYDLSQYLTQVEINYIQQKK